MSNLKIISDDQDFAGRLKSAGNDLVVVDFFTTWCGPCQKIKSEIISLAMKYPSVLFLKVDADACFETAMGHDLKGVPLFVLYRSMQVLDRIQGAQTSVLDARILSAEAEYRNRHLSQESAALVQNYVAKQNPPSTNDVGPVTLINASNYLEPAGCRVINDLSPSSFDAFLSGHKLISGRGSGKLLLVYTFREKLILHSFRIKAKPEHGPKVLRFFCNHPKVLDFHICSQLAPSQEVTLCPDDLSGEKAIEFRAGGFNLVTNLQIYVADVMQTTWRPFGYHPIQLESFKLFGAPVIVKEKPKEVLPPPTIVNLHSGATTNNNANHAHGRSQSNPPPGKPHPAEGATPAKNAKKDCKICSEEPNPYDYMYSFVRESRTEILPDHQGENCSGNGATCRLTAIPSKTGPYATLFGAGGGANNPTPITPPHRDSGYPEPPTGFSYGEKIQPKAPNVPTITEVIAENLRKLQIETNIDTSDEEDSFISPGIFAGNDGEIQDQGLQKEDVDGVAKKGKNKNFAKQENKPKSNKDSLNGNKNGNNDDSHWAKEHYYPAPTQPTVASSNKQSPKVGKDGRNNNNNKGVVVANLAKDKANEEKAGNKGPPQPQVKNRIKGRKGFK